MEDEKQLAPRRALTIVKHVLRGIGHAHASEIIHRDLKPENVLLVEHAGEQEFAKVLDFGIAKLVGEAEAAEGGEKLTQAGVAFGTPAYISPEQATGSNVDHRADLYSLSVMLYEMLTGRAPFVADDKMKLLAMHVTKTVPAFSEVAPDLGLPAALERLVRKGMEKDPVDRYQSSAEFIDAIDHYLARAEPRAATPLGGDLAPADSSATGGHGTVRAASTYHTGLSTVAPDRRRKWLFIGLGVAGFALFVAIIANAARSKGDPDDDPLPPLMRLLENGETCAARAKVIPALVELGDPRAVPGLNKAKARKDNDCLDKDAKKAIDALSKKRREATP
jgi:serine/threonine-protein kinase